MKKYLFVALLSVTTATDALHADQSLSIAGPANWLPNTTVTLSITDAFSGSGNGSYGLSYWLEISSALAPYVAITSVNSHSPIQSTSGRSHFFLHRIRDRIPAS